MKLLVLFFVVGHQAVRAQFPFSIPGFKLPSTIQPTQSLLIPFDNKVNQSLQSSQRIFEQFVNPFQLQDNSVTSFIQPFASFFNVSAFQSFLGQENLSRSLQLDSNIDFDSVPLLIRKTLQRVIEQFNSTLNAASARNLEKIESSIERLNETALSVINKTINVTESTIADIENRINQYNETVRECIGDNVSDYREIIPAARDNAVECVRNMRNEGFAIIDEARANIVEAINDVLNVTATIQLCSNSSNQQSQIGVFGCYTAAVLNIRSATILLPLKMARSFSEMDKSVSSTRGEIINCTAEIIETAAEQTLNVTETIASCLIKT